MHTKGPWKVHKITNATGYQLVVCAENLRCIAEIYYQKQPDGIANAALIAAAPDLLEALKAVMSDQEDHNKAIALAEIAIAKAEGR